VSGAPGASRATPAREVAFEVVRRSFEGGAWADRVFRASADRAGLEGRERAQAQRLAYGAVQRRATSDHLIARLAGRDPEELDPPVLAALRLGFYELLFADAVPDHAAVDQAVELAKGAGARRGAGLVNAVLRRAGREGEGLLAGLDDADAAGAALLHSVPPWLAELWWEELGPEEARSLLAACNRPAETALRVNTLKSDPAEALDGLRAGGVAAGAAGADPPLAPAEMLVLDGPLTAAAAERIDGGELVPQSRGSAAVVELLDPRPGERVLDLCAGPGIKTGQIAARMRDAGELTAFELDGGRAARLRESAARLGASCVRVLEADASRADLGRDYDRVLVDPPCSDLGTLASRPDARWRKSPQLIERLAELQSRILARACEALRPGGTLVYSTCTISRREDEARVEALLAQAGAGAVPALTIDDLGAEFPHLASRADSRTLQIRPDRDRTTGFFVARLRRHD
jgi:16S rRNA (cytosine967-C5)-methyltransferase